MAIQTAATAMLGIEHPIVCGGMTATGSAELAAGVSEAGGLGMLTCLHCRTPANLHAEIARCRSMTKKPFGVNLTIMGEKRGEPEYPDEFVQVITANHIRIVETCGASHPLMIKLHAQLKRGGVEVIIHKCVKVSQAKRAQEKLGVDMISLMGYDSGGLPGEGDMGIFVQAALAQKVLKIPFLLSGGVGTGQQLTAALALGAAGVQIGTAFNATRECVKFGSSYKRAMVEAGANGTVVVGKSFPGGASRVIRNRDAVEMMRIESEGGGRAGLKAGTLTFADVAHVAKFERYVAIPTNDEERRRQQLASKPMPASA